MLIRELLAVAQGSVCARRTRARARNSFKFGGGWRRRLHFAAVGHGGLVARGMAAPPSSTGAAAAPAEGANVGAGPWTIAAHPHPLMLDEAHVPGRSCDLCARSEKLAAGVHPWRSCRACSFDVCALCARDAATPAGAALAAAVPARLAPPEPLAIRAAPLPPFPGAPPWVLECSSPYAPHMDLVFSDGAGFRLFVGDLLSGHNREELLANGVTAIVNCCAAACGDAPVHWTPFPADFTYALVHTHDGFAERGDALGLPGAAEQDPRGQWPAALLVLESARAARGGALVHCAWGISAFLVRGREGGGGGPPFANATSPFPHATPFPCAQTAPRPRRLCFWCARGSRRAGRRRWPCSSSADPAWTRTHSTPTGRASLSPRTPRGVGERAPAQPPRQQRTPFAQTVCFRQPRRAAEARCSHISRPFLPSSRATRGPQNLGRRAGHKRRVSRTRDSVKRAS